MIRRLLIKIIFKLSAYITRLLWVKSIYRSYNFIYEHSPYFIVHIAGKYISLPDKNDDWEIILINGKTIKTKIYAENEKTKQFALSYKWHSPELNFTEYLLNRYFDRSIPWIDIGANLGMRSLLALSEGRSTFFVEPNKELNLINRERCELNNFSNYTFFEVGASNATEQASFFIDSSSYNSTLNRNLLSATEMVKEELIQIETIDNLFANRLDQSKTACMKIDVEGHELQVLEGAKCFILNFTPTMIVEVNGSLNNFIKFREIIKLYNYELFQITKPKSGKYFREIDKNILIYNLSIQSNDFLITKDIGLIKIINKYVY